MARDGIVFVISRNCAVSVVNEFLEALEIDRFVEAVITACINDLAVKLPHVPSV